MNMKDIYDRSKDIYDRANRPTRVFLLSVAGLIFVVVCNVLCVFAVMLPSLLVLLGIIVIAAIIAVYRDKF